MMFSGGEYEMRCRIWYHLYNLKNVENTHEGVLLLVKLQCLKISVTCRIDLALKKLVAKARRRGHEKCKSIGSITGTGHDSTRQDAKGSKGM